MSKNEYLNKKRNESIESINKKEKENKKIKEKIKENIIIGIINVKKNNLIQRIINSYENVKDEKSSELNGVANEEEIKESEIFINDKKINFTYYYKFPKEGEYKIKYIFRNLLKSTNYMFCNCNRLTSLDLSNFNSQNVINMKFMFSNCTSLESLNLSNFNTTNVTNMGNMFNYWHH